MMLEQRLANEMLAHATSAPMHASGYLEEACGILAAKDGVPARFYPTENSEHSPTRFVVAPGDYLKVDKDIRQNGLEIFAIFHSHTHSAAYPSKTDTNFAVSWPGVLYIIASLQEEPHHLRAFSIASDGAVSEEEMTYRG